MRYLFFYILFMVFTTINAHNLCSKEEYKKEIEACTLHLDAGLYVDAIEHISNAIECAKQLELEAEYIDASITLSELYRKTQDWQKGIDILTALTKTKDYPRLHARKLARLAAIYYEYWQLDKEMQRDTIDALLSEGIDIATRFKLPLIEADFRNQLGMLQCRDGQLELGISNFSESAKIFEKNGDFANEALALGHEFELYSAMREYEIANELMPILLNKIKDKEWYGTKVDIYNNVARHYIFLEDSLNYFRYKLLAGTAHIERLKKTHSDQMSFHRVIQSTAEAEEKAHINKKIADKETQKLKEEQSKTQQLVLVLGFFILVFLVIIFLMIREKKLKKTLKQTADNLHEASEKYQLLLVESNHRIKNNLQMILSMLEFKAIKTGKRSQELEKITGNIKAITALHKHLSLDVHSPKVNLIQYLKEIAALYREFTPQNFEVKTNLNSIEIKSERIVYFGLLFNEMLSNTIEHSLDEKTKIEVYLKREKDNYSFSYTDGSSWDKSKNVGTGSSLIPDLVERVEGINYSLDSSKGFYNFEFES